MTNITIVTAVNGITAKLKRSDWSQAAFDRGIPVYALFVPSEHLDQDIERLPTDPRLHLEPKRPLQYKSCNHDIDNGHGCQLAGIGTRAQQNDDPEMKLSVVIPCYNERPTIESCG